MEALLSRKLLIFAGKGGVGKTTTSCAAALALAKSGRKTLLVTVDPAKRLEDALGLDVGFVETPIQPNLAALMLDPGEVITEHLEREVPDAKITEHPMYSYVTQYMPGLNELMAIGKLNDLRREGKYDVIVIDTAPTGHALSFLSVPKAMKELMSEKSLLKWAIRGYQVWQKLQGAARGVGNAFKKKEERKAPPPDIDFERIFENIQHEAEEIQEFLGHPENAALVLVTLPEKLPVEETLDLHRAVTQDLGMTVAQIVVNKMQPDVLGALAPDFDALTPEAVGKAMGKAGYKEELGRALVEATKFSEVRRTMNEAYVAQLRRDLPAIPLLTVPLFDQDVEGLPKLRRFSEELLA